VRLQEASIHQDSMGEENAAFMTYGAGFAVFQERCASLSTSKIIIEKVERRASKSSSMLIKSGDTVMFKILVEGRTTEDDEIRYLTVHKGWWLKWVTTASKKNGCFTVWTHESEYDEDTQMTETQSSFVTFGGSFRIAHKRWSKYQVGVAAEASAAYGGRMLGLHSLGKNSTMLPPEDDDFDDELLEADNMEGGVRTRTEWLRPLQLRAIEANVVPIHRRKPSESSLKLETKNSNCEDFSWLYFSSENYRLDVPAWIEMMNRSDRVRQLAYILRVSPQDEFLRREEEKEDSENVREPFMRLRTGRDLSQAMRVGLNWRNYTIDRIKDPPGQPPLVRSPYPRKQTIESLSPMQDFPIDPISSSGMEDNPADDSSFVSKSFDPSNAESTDGQSDEHVEVEAEEEEGTNRHRGHRKNSSSFVGLIAKSFNAHTATGSKKVAGAGKMIVQNSVKGLKGTVNVGVKVGKGTVKVGKGTVNAGKANILMKSPPSKAPKIFGISRTTNAMHLHVSKSKRANRKLYKTEHIVWMGETPDIIAGELTGPEQSCRTVSNMLTKMSSLPPSSEFTSNFNALLALQVHGSLDQEKQFLTGKAMDVGVISGKGEASKGWLLHESVIARCLWESHWREEWCGVYDNHLAFYAPLTDVPCLELSLADIKSVRVLDVGVANPLPGYPMLTVETAWMCHYMAFASDDKRQMFCGQLQEAIERAVEGANFIKRGKETKDLAQARFWQGFQSSVQSNFSSGKGKWADITCGNKTAPRTVLNNRRMSFDLFPLINDPVSFTQDLLSTSLSFSLDHLMEHPEDLVVFLDGTCQLRNFPLEDLDCSSIDAFCIFVNIYHCLFQHALLLSVGDPLEKRSFGQFMRSSCYEVKYCGFTLVICLLQWELTLPSSL
jgi:hypothetical protein